MFNPIDGIDGTHMRLTHMKHSAKANAHSAQADVHLANSDAHPAKVDVPSAKADACEADGHETDALCKFGHSHRWRNG